jgi:hypothetical protein
MRNILFSLIWVLVGGFFIPAEPQGEMARLHAKHGQAVQERLRQAYGELPLSFEVNQGQVDPDIKFLSRGQGYALLLKFNEAVLALQKPSTGSGGSKLDPRNPNPESPMPAVLRLRLVGASPSPRVSGEERLPGKVSYFIGNDPARWRTNVPTYQKVRYEGVYPGVDLLYYGKQGQVEYDFVLEPGAPTEQLQLRFEGGRAQIDTQGDLLVAVDGASVVFRKPLAYQPDRHNAATKHFVAAAYVLKGHNQVGFRVSPYDTQRPLVIDPMLSYATYLGGSYGDTANGIALDSSGNAYVTGSTTSTNFPTSSAYQGTNAGGADIFVAKLDSTGATLTYSTYLGGNDYDSGSAIAVDLSGNVYITGATSSSNFPTQSTVFQQTYGGKGDAFVVKLDAAGSLAYASFLGGSEPDYGQGIAVDRAGNAYVTGSTGSTDFPTASAFQGGNDGSYDAFVAKVNNSGSALIFSTYLGGGSADSGQGITLDSSGNAYVVGYTYSSNFPTVNPLQDVNVGSADAFVAKLKSDGSGLLYATYLGGSDLDRGTAIALDATGNIYLTGDTRSVGFPVTTGAFQTTKGQDDTNNDGKYREDAFVTKLNPTGSQLVYSTYLGKSGADQGTGIAVDSLENAYVTGFTESRDFPTANALQASFGGGTCGTHPCADAFVTELNPQGTSLVYSTFLGGIKADFGNGLCLDSSSDAYVAGSTASANFTPTAGVGQGAPGDTAGNGDAFVAKVSHTNAPAVALSPQKITFDNQAIDTTSDPVTVTLTDVGTVPLNITDISASADFAQTNDCLGTVPASGGRCTIRITFTPTTLQTQTAEIAITDDASGSPHKITVTGTGVSASTEVTFSPTSLEFASQTVGTTSQPKTVTLTNTGDLDLTIESVSTSGDFAQTNNCPSTMGVGASCTITVSFTPTGSGTRTGGLAVTDNATGSPQGVVLIGTGVSVFSLAVDGPSKTILIGTTSTTFTISAVAPSSFTDSISLYCATGATCSFVPTSIKAGESSTVTVSGLSASTANPLNLTVGGTSNEQTATLSLAIFFADFTLSASPSLNTVPAGQSVTYTITVTPSNGFNQPVLLSCASGLPDGASCSFSPSAVTPDGSAPLTSTLTVSTTARTSMGGPRSGPRLNPPHGTIPFGVPWLLSCLALATFAGLAARRKRLHPATCARGRVVLARLAFAVLVLSSALLTSCESGYYTSIIKPAATSGSQVGNYTIIIKGALSVGSTEVARAATVNLAVS